MVDELVHGSMSLRHIDFDKVKLVSQLRDFLHIKEWIAKRELRVGTMFSSFCDRRFYFCLSISVEHLLSVSDHSLIHLFVHTFNQHVFTSTRYETKMCKTWILLQRPPIFKATRSLAIKPFVLSVSVLQILSYLVTDFKLLAHSWSLLLACSFSFAVHANSWI